jgi:hypothetical protein
MRRAVLACGVAIALAALLPPEARSQQGPTRLRGKVVAEDGRAIVGARLRTDAVALGRSQFIGQRRFDRTSDRRGEWILLGLTPGTWIFELTAPGYSPSVVVLPLWTLPSPTMPTPVTFVLQSWDEGASSEAARADARVVREAVEAAIDRRRGDAIAALNRLEGVAPSAHTLVAAGNAALLVRDLPLAHAFFLRAATADPELGAAHMGLASAALLREDIDLAIKAYWNAREAPGHDSIRQAMSEAVRNLQRVRPW